MAQIWVVGVVLLHRPESERHTNKEIRAYKLQMRKMHVPRRLQRKPRGQQGKGKTVLFAYRRIPFCDSTVIWPRREETGEESAGPQFHGSHQQSPSSTTALRGLCLCDKVDNKIQSIRVFLSGILESFCEISVDWWFSNPLSRWRRKATKRRVARPSTKLSPVNTPSTFTSESMECEFMTSWLCKPRIDLKDWLRSVIIGCYAIRSVSALILVQCWLAHSRVEKPGHLLDTRNWLNSSLNIEVSRGVLPGPSRK